MSIRLQFRIRTLLLVTVVVAVVFGALVVLFRPQSEVGRFRLGPDLEIRFSVDNYWEHWPPLYYEIRKEGKVAVHQTYLTAYRDKMLSIVDTAESADGSVIGFWAAGAAETVFVLYHVPSGESWPRDAHEASWSDKLNRDKWNARHALLKANHPGLPLPDSFMPGISDEWTKRE